MALLVLLGNIEMQIIESLHYEQKPWKNGGGTTTQIMALPAGATTDNFELRISMAAVALDGPFSAFPGIDRTLVVLEGAGIFLAVADNPVERIDRLSKPFSFAADAPTNAALIDGPILDFNVMTRRGCFSHRVLEFSTPTAWRSISGVIILFAHGASLQVDDGTQSIRIKLGDTGIFDDGAMALNIVPENSGVYYLVAATRV